MEEVGTLMDEKRFPLYAAVRNDHAVNVYIQE